MRGVHASSGSQCASSLLGGYRLQCPESWLTPLWILDDPELSSDGALELDFDLILIEILSELERPPCVIPWWTNNP